MLELPQMSEQEVNADRLVALGLGRRLDPALLTVDELRSSVEEVVASPAIRAEVDRMRTFVRPAGGSLAGADAIKVHVAGAPHAPGGPSIGPAPPRRR